MSQTGTPAGHSVRMRSSIVDARKRLSADREKLKHQHESGSPGIQVCTHLSDVWDGIVLDILEQAASEVSPEIKILANIALVPHGGYGRRDVAPFSDMDLMLLHEPSVEKHVGVVARRLVTDLSDLGIELGFSVRTKKQAIRMARRDPVIFTSEVESRYLAGSVRLFSSFFYQFRQDAKRRFRKLLPRIIRARVSERVQFGETTYWLEPDVKRTLGGLRDIHLLRWIGFARYGEPAPTNLRLMGLLLPEDERAVRRAYEFLLRLRNELHFAASRTHDVLNRNEQLRIAEKWGYQGEGRLQPMQQFMRDYFRHTTDVREIVENFIANARQPSRFSQWMAPLLTHRMDEDFLVGPTHISTTKQGLQRLRGDVSEVLRLMVLANQTNRRIAQSTWKAAREHMISHPDLAVSGEAARRFMELLTYTARLGNLLRRLHDLRVLEKLVAGMDHARFLIQFNQYHKYTVDEHCIRAVECATAFFSHTGTLGRVYRSIKQRNILHLALLVHDLGKGFDEDHSRVGKRLARETALRLRLTPRQSRLLQFLVEKHLIMSHIAFLRDTNDAALIHQFANDVGTPETLRMLYVLTAADLAAVGSDVLNPWKIDMLTSLYLRTIDRLVGHGTTPDSVHQAELLRSKVDASLPNEDQQWYRRQIQALPNLYLIGANRTQVIKDLQMLHNLKTREVVSRGRYSEKRKISIYKIGMRQAVVHHVFIRLIAVMAEHGMQILSAHMHQIEDQLAFVEFYVEDRKFQGTPPAERIQAVSDQLAGCVGDEGHQPPIVRKLWQSSSGQPNAKFTQLPIRVEFDNSTLPDQTIVDIFSPNRADLLYSITRVLRDMGAQIYFIKSGGYLDQVVSVFYVTDETGSKIEDENRINELRMLLLTTVEKG